MLERASACLDSGIRLTLRRQGRFPRSRRLLHSTFWNHGADDIDLPPWAMSMFPFPAVSSADASRSVSGSEPVASVTLSQDAGWLDFLYPPQTVAFMNRLASHGERRVRRHASSLPLHGGRGYASLSQPQEEDNSHVAGKKSFGQDSEVMRGSGEAKHQQHMARLDIEHPDSREMPSEELERILQKEHGSTPALRAWAIWSASDQETRSDHGLQTRLMVWLSNQGLEHAAQRAMLLFERMPLDLRTPPAYRAAVVSHLHLRNLPRAMRVHREGSERCATGLIGSDYLMRYAVSSRNWALAVKLVMREQSRTNEGTRDFQHALFALTSTVPKFYGALDDLVMVLESRRHDELAMRSLRLVLQGLCVELVRTMDVTTTGRFVHDTSRIRLSNIMSRVAQQRLGSTHLFTSCLAALARIPRPDDASAHFGLISSIYALYQEDRSFKPTKKLLHRLLFAYRDFRLRDSGGQSDLLNAEVLVEDWRKYHGRLSEGFLFRLMEFSAQMSDVGHVDTYFQEYRQLCRDTSQPLDKEKLWPVVYVHALRRDPASALRALERVREALNDTPDIRCFNILIHAYQRSSDLQGALDVLHQVFSANLTPTEYTFGPLLSIYGTLGDVDGVSEMLALAKIHTVPLTTHMINSQILAHANAGFMNEAEALLQEAVIAVEKKRAKGSLTLCYNTVMAARAQRREIDKVIGLYQRMRAQDIILDANSYASIISALSLRRLSESAYKIIRKTMPSVQLAASSLHYAIVMAGFINQDDPERALQVHADMRDAHVKGTISTRMAYIKAKAMLENRALEREYHRTGNVDVRSMPLSESIDEITSEIKRGDAVQFGKHSEPGLRAASSETASAALFDFLIFLHGVRRCFEAAQQLLATYTTELAPSNLEESPPVRLLTALMIVHIQTGDQAAVKKCWAVIKRECDRLRRVPLPPPRPNSSDLDTLMDSPHAGPDPESNSRLAQEPSQGLSAQPAPALRFIPSRPLRLYLYSLFAIPTTPRIAKMTRTVTSMLSQSYELDNKAWNTYISYLCRSSPPRTLFAFTLVERYLIRNFSGWQRPSSVILNPNLKASAKQQGLEYMRQRYVRPDLPVPMYSTMVYLAAALLEVRRMETTGTGLRSSRARRRNGRVGRIIDVEGERTADATARHNQQVDEDYEDNRDVETQVGTMAEIRRRAPRTLAAVQNMPKVYDGLQQRLIRNDNEGSD